MAACEFGAEALVSPPLQQRPLTLQQFRWELNLMAVIGVVITTLALVTRLFGHPDYSLRASSLRVPTPTKLDSPAAKSPRRPSQPPDPHQVTVGPNTISGRFILLGSERKHINPTSDELTLRLRVVSLAAANLVTPYQSWMLKVQAPGRSPIEPKESFSSRRSGRHPRRRDRICYAARPEPGSQHIEYQLLQ